MTKILCFSITGEFVTNTARDWLYAEKKPYEKVIDFLLSCMAGTDLDNETLVKYANDILAGKKKMIGDTRNDSYCMVDDDTDIINKYKIYFKNDPTVDRFIKTDTDDEECSVYWAVEKNKNQFVRTMTRQIKKTLEDYGWLRPDGKFFPCEWGSHESWAAKYIEKYYPNDEVYYSGDFLVEKGWILLHSPMQGIPNVSTFDIQSATKRQKEFLYDYFLERNMNIEANLIWKEAQ
jgi:hypothetical protein